MSEEVNHSSQKNVTVNKIELNEEGWRELRSPWHWSTGRTCEAVQAAASPEFSSLVEGEESFQVSQDSERKWGCHSLSPHSSPQGALHFHFALGPTNDVAGLAPRLPTQQEGQHMSPREETEQSGGKDGERCRDGRISSLSCVRLFVTPWTAACQASLSITNSQSLLTHVLWVGDAIQSFHPLSSPSPPAFNLSQHQGLF